MQFPDFNGRPPAILGLVAHPDDEVFCLLSGSADIIHELEDRAREHLATSGPGSFFGEDGIAKGQPRSAHEALSCHHSQYAIDPDLFPDSLLQGFFGMEYFRPVS